MTFPNSSGYRQIDLLTDILIELFYAAERQGTCFLPTRAAFSLQSMRKGKQLMLREGSGHLDSPQQPAWTQGLSRNPQAPGAGPSAEDVFYYSSQKDIF